MAATRDAQITGKFLDKSGAPIPGASMTFTIGVTGSATPPTSLGPVITDANGLGTVTVTALPVPNKFDITANVTAVGYDPSSGSVLGFQINAGTQAIIITVTAQ